MDWGDRRSSNTHCGIAMRMSRKARNSRRIGKGGALFAAGNKIIKTIRAEPFGSARVFFKNGKFRM